jgi:hypothetical protein
MLLAAMAFTTGGAIMSPVDYKKWTFLFCHERLLVLIALFG